MKCLNVILWKFSTLQKIHSRPLKPPLKILRVCSSLFLSDFMVLVCSKYIFGKFRSFLKTSENFFSKFSSGALLSGISKLPYCKKSRFQGLKGQKSLMTQKIDFFKVRYINTAIQPQRKKHQTNVSSALKTF